MKQKRDSSLRGPVRRAVLTVAIVGISLGFAGCSKQMARIDENQVQLQMMVKANSLQITELARSLERNQQELHAVVAGVQNGVAKVAADVAAVADAQMKLDETIRNSSVELSGRIAAIGQDQQDLSAGLGHAIEGVRGETKKVAADVGAVAADLTAVTAEQARLYETMQQNNEDLTGKVAGIEQAQQERQNTIGGMEDNINTLAAGISGLGQDVLRLQEILQSNIRELVSIADVTGQKQNEFQESIRMNLQALDESLASLRQSQKDLQSRIEQIRNETPDLSDVPAAIDQLRDQLEELSRSRMSAENSDEIEYETSADVSTEATSIE